MKLFDLLKGFVQVNFNFDALIKINGGTFNFVRLPSSKETILQNPDGTYSLNLSALTPEQQKSVFQHVRDNFKDFPGLVGPSATTQSASILKFDTVESLREIYYDLLPFVPKSYHAVIRSAYYMRYVDQVEGNHKRAKELKSDLVSTYPDYGSKVANVVRQGYLENWILPRLKILKSMGKTDAEIHQTFEYLIHQSSFSMFVNQVDSFDSQLETAISKIETWRTCGINWVNIHGMGASVPNAIKMKDEIKKYFGAENISNETMDLKQNVVDIKLEFK